MLLALIKELQIRNMHFDLTCFLLNLTFKANVNVIFVNFICRSLYMDM